MSWGGDGDADFCLDKELFEGKRCSALSETNKEIISMRENEEDLEIPGF